MLKISQKLEDWFSMVQLQTRVILMMLFAVPFFVEITMMRRSWGRSMR